MTALTLDVVGDEEGFAALRGEWADLAAADPDPNVFLTWSWANAWWQHVGAGHDDHALHIVVVRDGPGLVGIAPLYRRRVGAGPLAVTSLQRINHEAGDYSGMLLGRRAGEAVAVLVDHLGAQLHGNVAVAVLSRLASDARFTALLGDELVRHAATIETVVSETVSSPGGADRAAEPAADAAVSSAEFPLADEATTDEIRRRLRRLGDDPERHLSTVTLSRPGLSGAVARQRARVTGAAARRLHRRRR